MLKKFLLWLNPFVSKEEFDFNFDDIDHHSVKNLDRWFFGNENALLTYPKPKGVQKVTSYLFDFASTQTFTGAKAVVEKNGLEANPWHLLALIIKKPTATCDGMVALQWQGDNGRQYHAIFRQDEVEIDIRSRDFLEGRRFAGSTGIPVI